MPDDVIRVEFPARLPGGDGDGDWLTDRYHSGELDPCDTPQDCSRIAHADGVGEVTNAHGGMGNPVWSGVDREIFVTTHETGQSVNLRFYGNLHDEALSRMLEHLDRWWQIRCQFLGDVL